MTISGAASRHRADGIRRGTLVACRAEMFCPRGKNLGADPVLNGVIPRFDSDSGAR